MTFTEWLGELKGNTTQVEFAQVLGVSQSLLSRVLSGETPPGKSILLGAVAAYPEHKQALNDSFFAQEYASTHGSMNESMEVA